MLKCFGLFLDYLKTLQELPYNQKFFPPGGDFLKKMITGLPENGCLGMVMTRVVLKSQETTVRGDARRGTQRYSDGQANRGLEEVISFRETLE